MGGTSAADRSPSFGTSPFGDSPRRGSVRYLLPILIAAMGAAAASPIRYRADQSSSDLKSGQITLRHHVTAWGEDFTLHATEGTYRMAPEEIALRGEVVGTWKGDSAWCAMAHVNTQDSTVDLKGSVRLRTEDGSTLSCSRLLYRSAYREVLLTGPVALQDSTSLYQARGDSGWYVRSDENLYLAGQCTLFIRAPGTQLVRVASDTTIIGRSSGRATARGNVTILGESVTGTCQAMDFVRNEDRIVLTGSPQLSGRSIRCQGARIVLQRKDGELRQLVLQDKAWAARTGETPADSSTWDQAWGDRMVVWITGGDPSTLLVTGSARATHQVRDRAGTALGHNSSHGDSITLGMGQEMLRDVRIAGNARGTYRPRVSDTGLPGEQLDYKSQTLEYAETSGVLVMTGAAELTSGTAKLTAETVKFSPTSREMVALGGAVLRDGAQEIEGEVMTFDVDRRQGVVSQGSTEFEKAFSLGKRVARIDSRRLDIADGRFTSCDEAHPHFYITAPRMRVELDNKVVARSLVLRIHDVPLFYLPYWIFPIRRDRHSGFLMPSFSVRNILGLQGSRAGITDLGYYFVLGDYADAEITLDWNEGLGWTLNGLVNYALRYRIPSGSVRASYARRENTATWSVQERHEQILPRGWRLTANVNATSSKTFIDQQTWDELDRLNQQAGLRSDVTLAKSLAGWGVRASLRRDQTWSTALTESTSTTTETITSVLPEVALSRPSKRLFPVDNLRSPWYAELYASLSTTFRNRIVESDAGGGAEGAATGTVHAVQLSWQLPKVLRKFTLAPRATYHETWIHRGMIPADGERLTNDRYGVLHDVGVSTSTKLYGLWRPPLPWDMTFRHVISPAIGFSYTPDWFLHGWGLSTGHFSEGDGVAYAASGFGSAYAKSRRLTFGLGNVFQLKTRKGETTVKNDNLANLNFSTGYDLEKRDAGEDPWSTLTTTFTLSPGRGVSWNLNASHDPNESWVFKSITSTVTARIGSGWDRPAMVGPDGQLLEAFRGTWDLSATHSYSHQRGRSDEPQTLYVTANLAPTKGWRISGWANYDMLRNRVSNKSLTLTRDLHCWQADFKWYQAENSWHYLFKVFVKAYPQSLFVKHEERG